MIEMSCVANLPAGTPCNDTIGYDQTQGLLILAIIVIAIVVAVVIHRLRRRKRRNQGPR
jgi:hypothetical protein